MSKKNSNSGPSAAAARKELERVDRDLLKLISDRTRITQKLARARQQEGGHLHDMAEEHTSLQKLLEGNKGPLTEAAVHNIWRELQGQARALIQPQRIAYLGPKFSYSHLAGIAKFGDSTDRSQFRNRLAARTLSPWLAGQCFTAGRPAWVLPIAALHAESERRRPLHLSRRRYTVAAEPGRTCTAFGARGGGNTSTHERLFRHRHGAWFGGKWVERCRH